MVGPEDFRTDGRDTPPVKDNPIDKVPDSSTWKERIDEILF